MGLLRESSSRDKQVVLVYTSLAVVFVLLYLLLFPRILGAELTVVPVQATVLGETKADRLSAGGSFFLLGDREGYWSADGKLEQVKMKRPQATVSGDKIAWYDPAQSRVVVESPAGPLFSLAGEQYPVWLGNRLFTLDENRLGLTAFGAQGRVLWRKHFSSLITSLDATEKLTVVGTLDGRMQVFGVDGNNAGGFQPGGSRLPVIYNVALSPDESSILVLAGVDPKRFLVLERGGSDFRPVFHKPLKERSPWPTPLGFLNHGTLAYYETDKGLAILNPRAPDQEVVIAAAGSTSALESLWGDSLVMFVQKDGNKQWLRVASVTGASVMTLPFAAQDLLLRRQGANLFLGIDQTLLRLEVKIQ